MTKKVRGKPKREIRTPKREKEITEITKILKRAVGKQRKAVQKKEENPKRVVERLRREKRREPRRLIKKEIEKHKK